LVDIKFSPPARFVDELGPEEIRLVGNGGSSAEERL
jgi:hypothetical protein